jgi:uncharacterized protein (TIGR03086 family)
MSETADRYRRLSKAFAEKIASVPEDRWASPSPCEGWTARDVVRHVVEIHGMFTKLVDLPLRSDVSVDGDPAGAFEQVREQMQAHLDDPASAGREFDGYFGRSTFETTVDRFVNFDLVAHGWDLSRATGIDERIDADDIARLEADLAFFGDAARSPKVFGPALEPPPGADAQARLLANLGRRP